jgi:secretion/DNA translocation related CpaE-like protein
MAGPLGRMHVLCVLDDPVLSEHLRRQLDDIGLRAEVIPDPETARWPYMAATLVLVGHELAEPFADLGLPRRTGVFLATLDEHLESAGPLARRIGAERVLRLPYDEIDLYEVLSSATDRVGLGQVTGRGKMLAVLGGRGGAGASVLAAGLSVTAVREGLSAMLIDADPLGGGVDLVLGWEDVRGIRWPDLVDIAGPIDPPDLVGALPRRGDLSVLSCSRDDIAGLSPETMALALEAGRARRDLVVVDLPRRIDDSASVVLGAADRVLLVVPAEVRACAAATRVAAAASVHTDALSVVVRGPSPGRLRTREVARALKLPLAGALRAETGLPHLLEKGMPPAGTGRGPLAELCRKLIVDLDIEHVPADEVIQL